MLERQLELEIEMRAEASELKRRQLLYVERCNDAVFFLRRRVQAMKDRCTCSSSDSNGSRSDDENEEWF